VADSVLAVDRVREAMEEEKVREAMDGAREVRGVCRDVFRGYKNHFDMAYITLLLLIQNYNHFYKYTNSKNDYLK
jgi:hypothetical protein